MIVSDMPTCFVALILFLLLVVIASFIFGNSVLVQDVLISSGVLGVFLVIQKKRTLTLDKKNGVARLVERSLLGQNESIIKLSDVLDVRLISGKGEYRHAGGLALHVDQSNVIFVGADMCLGHHRRILRLREEIEDWLKT